MFSVQLCVSLSGEYRPVLAFEQLSSSRTVHLCTCGMFQQVFLEHTFWTAVSCQSWVFGLMYNVLCSPSYNLWHETHWDLKQKNRRFIKHFPHKLWSSVTKFKWLSQTHYECTILDLCRYPICWYFQTHFGWYRYIYTHFFIFILEFAYYSYFNLTICFLRKHKTRQTVFDSSTNDKCILFRI